MVGKRFPKFGKKNSVGTMENLYLSKELKEFQEKLDPDAIKDMKTSLNDLTASGSSSLDITILKQFKKLCRKSDDYVKYAFFLIMQQLQKKHSEIRLSGFQIAKELFHRSHAFREVLITHLQEFLSLITETEAGLLLPPPKLAATKLKTDALRTMQEWHDKFGKVYRKLAVGYDYLKNCKHVDFDNIQAQTLAERQRLEQEERRKEKLMADRLANVLLDIKEHKVEIEDCLKEADSCIKLILPTLLDFDLPPSPSSGNEKDHKQIPLACSSNNDPEICDDNSHDNSNNKQIYERNQCNNNDGTSTTESCSSGFELSQDHLNEGRKNEKKNKDVTDVSQDDNLKTDNPCNKQYNEINSCNSRSVDSLAEKCHLSTVNEGTGSSGKLALDCEYKSCSKMTNSVSGDKSDSEKWETDSSDDEFDEDEIDLQIHGFRRPGFHLTIEVPPENATIKETEDNTDIMQSLKDASKLISGSHIPKVTKWLEILGKNGAKEQDMKELIDLKVKLQSMNSKCVDMKLVIKEMVKHSNDSEYDDDDDDDLEDVPEKEGYEPGIPEHMEKDYGLSSFNNSSASGAKNTPSSLPLKRKASTSCTDDNSGNNKMSTTASPWKLKQKELSDNAADPTSSAATLARIYQNWQESAAGSTSSLTSCHEDKKSDAPFINFGKDLAYWENPDEMEAPSIVKYDSLHHFWRPAEKETEKASQLEKAVMQYRVINFSGKFEPVKWKCRALMPNGTLCERMDRIKCPFHGKIIARDEDGKASGPSSEMNEKPNEESGLESIKTETEIELETKKQELPPWQDPVLQREIEAATGHNLGSARSQKLCDKGKKGKGKGKGRRKKTSSLTNIKAATNTARKRLEKRIFNKSSLRKVCNSLDAADYKRVRDKFLHQFNYQ